MTPWRDAIGKVCGVCGGPATHAYGDIWICCCCHVGERDGGLMTREQAEKIHRGESPFDGVMAEYMKLTPADMDAVTIDDIADVLGSLFGGPEGGAK